jgi:hypothetical protein
VPKSYHGSLFTLEMCFLPTQTGADVWQTQQHVAPPGQTFTYFGPTRHILPSAINANGQLFQHFQDLCHWWTLYHTLQFTSQNQLFQRDECSYCVQLLAEHELLYGLYKTYCTNHSHFHVTGSLPHTVHLTYEEFLLVPLSVSL